MLEAEDRTEEIIGGTKPIEAKQSTAQMPRKDKGDCRLVVEFPFSFPKWFLVEQSEKLGVNLVDGVDYLRVIKKRFEYGDISLADVAFISSQWSGNGIRVDAAK